MNSLEQWVAALVILHECARIAEVAERLPGAQGRTLDDAVWQIRTAAQDFVPEEVRQEGRGRTISGRRLS